MTKKIQNLHSLEKPQRRIGSAHSGSGAWLAERLTSIALVPLTIWFIASVISLGDATRDDMITWLHAPVSLFFILCLCIVTFCHMELGLRVVVEDYVHKNSIRRLLLLLQRGLCIVAGLSCVTAAMYLSLWEGRG